MSAKEIMKLPRKTPWVYDHESVPGYTLSIRYQETYHGPVMTDLCISVSEPADIRAKPENGPWIADLYFEPTIAGEAPRRVTIQALQKIKLSEIAKSTPEPDEISDEGWREFFAEIRELGRPRRRDEFFFAAISQLYLRAASKTQRGVYREMLVLEPDLWLAEDTLKDIVKQAKRQGFIDPPPERGATKAIRF